MEDIIKNKLRALPPEEGRLRFTRQIGWRFAYETTLEIEGEEYYIMLKILLNNDKKSMLYQMTFSEIEAEHPDNIEISYVKKELLEEFIKK